MSIIEGSMSRMQLLPWNKATVSLNSKIKPALPNLCLIHLANFICSFTICQRLKKYVVKSSITKNETILYYLEISMFGFVRA